MLRNVNILVRRCPDTLRYSHDLIAKKNAPVNNWHIAMSSGVKAIFCNSLITDPVKVTCCFSGLSNFLYPLNCLYRNKEGFPSSSSLGSGLFAKRKVCAMQSMVVRHDSDLIGSDLLELNLPSLIA